MIVLRLGLGLGLVIVFRLGLGFAKCFVCSSLRIVVVVFIVVCCYLSIIESNFRSTRQEERDTYG